MVSADFHNILFVDGLSNCIRAVAVHIFMIVFTLSSVRVFLLLLFFVGFFFLCMTTEFCIIHCVYTYNYVHLFAKINLE